MSVIRKIARLILYQKPQQIPEQHYTSGEWDPGADSTGREKPDQTQTQRRMRSPQTPEEKKYQKILKKNKEVEDFLKTNIVPEIENNKKILEAIFRLPNNKDVVIRSFSIGTSPPVKAFLIFIDGLTNLLAQNLTILQPLMFMPGLREGRYEGPPEMGRGKVSGKIYFERVIEALLPDNQLTTVSTFEDVVNDVLSGNTALFIDGADRAILIETKGWKHRSVERPQVESVIRGPQEAFTEQIRINTSLVRKILRRPSLITEFIKVGNSAPMQCAIMYLEDIANPKLVKEVKRRLESIKADFLHETGLIEQMIEDQPYFPAPQVLTTERPDRAAAGILDGKVAIIIDGSPFAMIVPATFFDIIQSAEDAYVRWPFGSFIRLVRYLGLGLAMLLPAIYISVAVYHQEFLPTDLLLAMTGNREKVPFPTIIEVLLMEVSFELIREAGIRMPGSVSTTLGIVGALILGQAAVAANIVSPILIVVVAVTAIGSLAIPNYSFGLTLRAARFGYILLASVLGLLGVVLGLFVHLSLMANARSFGVPYMAPLAPTTRSSPDYLLRGPAWRQESRPDYLDPLKRRSQAEISRGWTSYSNNEDGSDPGAK